MSWEVITSSSCCEYGFRPSCNSVSGNRQGRLSETNEKLCTNSTQRFCPVEIHFEILHGTELSTLCTSSKTSRCLWPILSSMFQLVQTVSEVGFRHSHWLTGAVSEAGFRRMLVIFHDNMSDTRVTNQAINGSVFISFMFSPLNWWCSHLGQFCGLFSIAYASWPISSKQHGGAQAYIMLP